MGCGHLLILSVMCDGLEKIWSLFLTTGNRQHMLQCQCG
jgi:hypothetical protein